MAKGECCKVWEWPTEWTTRAYSLYLICFGSTWWLKAPSTKVHKKAYWKITDYTVPQFPSINIDPFVKDFIGNSREINSEIFWDICICKYYAMIVVLYYRSKRHYLIYSIIGSRRSIIHISPWRTIYLFIEHCFIYYTLSHSALIL